MLIVVSTRTHTTTVSYAYNFRITEPIITAPPHNVLFSLTHIHIIKQPKELGIARDGAELNDYY